MTIRVKVKLNYGKEYFYPVSELAIAICEILGRKTLTKKQLEILAHRGVEVIKEQMEDE